MIAYSKASATIGENDRGNLWSNVNLKRLGIPSDCQFLIGVKESQEACYLRTMSVLVSPFPTEC